ncbi:MAG: hypothetical protein AMJ90_06000 [candidate division Zixibacteria bacterium SM23_73_2]|nr:MAG: hypothetical protein AMJ90_06000 [candidate division Zixibacteria bacterium SM23_73_2]
MDIEEDDLEEIGEAIEELGGLLEEGLEDITRTLSNIEEFLEKKQLEDKKQKEEFFDLKKETIDIKELLESFDLRLAGLEKKATELFIGFQEEIEKIKKQLESLRSDNDLKI